MHADARRDMSEENRGMSRRRRDLRLARVRRRTPPRTRCTSSFARKWRGANAEAISWELRHPISPVLAKVCAGGSSKSVPSEHCVTNYLLVFRALIYLGPVSGTGHCLEWPPWPPNRHLFPALRPPCFVASSSRRLFFRVRRRHLQLLLLAPLRRRGS